MKSALQLSVSDDLHAVFSEVALPRLEAELARAGRQQRLRVSALPSAVMRHLCAKLQARKGVVTRLLADTPVDSWHATATKLIELRNTLDEPLLVFVPPGARTAAEDSLDIATFTELTLPDFANEVAQHLLQKLSADVAPKVGELLQSLREQKLVRHDDEIVEYLVTVLKNGGSAAAAGGALFVFGLVPDFDLFTRANMQSWLSRNRNAKDALADVKQPLSTRVCRLPIAPGALQTGLLAFLRDRHSDDTRAWAKEIGTDPAQLHLSLDTWPFNDKVDDDTKLRLILDPLNLAEQEADEVSGTASMPVLDLSGRDGLKASFRSLPPPALAPTWATFRFQLLSLEGDQPMEVWDSYSFPKPKGGRKAAASRTIKVDDLAGLPEGTYVLRVNAYDKDGTLITTAERVEPDNPQSRFENESAPFFIAQEKASVVQPEHRAIPVPSLLDAWLALRTKAKLDEPAELSTMTGAWAEPANAAVRGDTHFRLEGDSVSAYSVVLPGLLRKFEFDILRHPEQLGAFKTSRLDIARRQSDVNIERRSFPPLPSSPSWLAFMKTRTDVFALILGQPKARNPGKDAAMTEGVVETADLLQIADPVRAYARAFIDCAAAATPDELALLAVLDVVELRWSRAPGDPGRGVLLAPTHPVRLLWHLQHAVFGSEAVGHARDKTAEVPSWKAFFDQVRRGMLPLNLPPVVFDGRGRGYVENGPLTPYWSLYLPDRMDGDLPVDVAVARDVVRRLLGVRGSAAFAGNISSIEIAERLLEYLQQHPYCEQLRLNVFNPGDGELLTDALRLVEGERLKLVKRGEPPQIRYSIQMFGPSEHIEEMGDAIESLLDPERQVSESDEEFTLSAANHLLPKLVFAKNTADDFLVNPARFPAHLSIFLEHFAVQSRLGVVSELRRGSFVRGLVEETETTLATDRDTGTYGWHRGLRPAGASKPGVTETLIVEGLSATQRAHAAAAMREDPKDIVPLVALQLGSRGQALLRHVHDVSDWVLTIDRNLGLDYFDSASSSSETGYLLDFAPEFLQEDRQRLLLTTRSTVELQAMVRPALERFGLKYVTQDELVVLECLRSLSGRLALRLLASANQSAEVMGLLLARWALEEAGAFEDRLVIPLDAHRRWFVGNDDDDLLGMVRSHQRADLLVVGLHPKARRLEMHIIEVKFREELGNDAQRIDLYAKMRSQSENTKTVLRRLFDQDLYPVPRADRELRAKELATVLGFYARRAHRYGLLRDEALRAALDFVQDLDGGYSIDFHTQGIAFEQRGLGEHHDEDEPGYPVHRFGLDVANELLARARSRAPRSPAGGPSGGPPGSLPPSGPSSDSTPAGAPPQGAVGSGRKRAFETLRDALGGATGLLASTPANAGSGMEAPIAAAATTTPVSPPTPSGPSVPPKAIVETDAEPSLAKVIKIESSVPVVQPQRTASRENTARSADATGPAIDILLGASELTVQCGVLGKTMAGETVGIDLLGCNTISLFGVQGFGKSYTLGVIAEMATALVPGINRLPAPLATVVFHYHKSDAYEPEYASAVKPNEKQREVERLLADFSARPQGLGDVVLLSPDARVEDRRKEFPELEVLPIKFSSAEVGADGWKFLLGAVGNDSLYVRQIVAIMRRHRAGLTVDVLRQELQQNLQGQAQQLALDRLALAEPYIDDTASLGVILRPGRTVIVDLRDEWIEKDEALGLFVVMMRMFAKAKHDARDFNKLMVFDEAHKYITESDLIGQVVETIREMRHQATSIVIASQDPLSVPRAVIELTSILVLHRMTSPQWLKHLKGAISALESVDDGHVSVLKAGEAIVWAQRSTRPAFTLRPQKIVIRPRFTQHGGGTKTAVAGKTVR